MAVMLHAGLVACRLAGHWRGALIRGPSGAGKSDLALRTLDAGFRLVADDRTLVWRSAGALFGRAPDALSGLIEARGQGLMREGPIGLSQITLVIDCAAPAEALERMPDPAFADIEQVVLPRLSLRAWEHSAPAKLARAMQHLGAASQRGYQTDPLGGPLRAGTGETP